MRNKHKMKNQGAIFLLLGILIFVCLNAACENPSLTANNAAANKTAANKVSDFERDLETMKTANFEYIFAFRRMDGGVFDDQDKQFLRINRPPQANRFISTDEDKAFIAGSHFPFSPENLEILRTRFNVEDYSVKKDAGQK